MIVASINPAKSPFVTVNSFNPKKGKAYKKLLKLDLKL